MKINGPLSFFIFRTLWHVKHCTELCIVPSNKSVTMLLQFTGFFFFFPTKQSINSFDKFTMYSTNKKITSYTLKQIQ